MEELLTLFMTGDTSDGDPEILQKGIDLFRPFVSDDIEDCFEHAVKNECSVWDYFPETYLEPDQVLNELWVDYLIRLANA